MNPHLQLGLPVSSASHNYYNVHTLLQSCILKKDIASGRAVCSLLVKYGIDQLGAYIGTHLIRMFSVCGSLTEANHVFESLHSRNVFSWCAIISANARAEMYEHALDLYTQMLESRVVVPDGHVFASVLHACAGASALSRGKLIHMQITEGRFQDDEYIGSTLLHMYSTCGHLTDAHKVFDDLPKKGLITWSAMISAYAQHGEGLRSLSLFYQMQHCGIEPDSVTLSSLLKACSGIESMLQGNIVYSYAIEMGYDTSIIVGNALIDMYVKCATLDNACTVFTALQNRDVVTWSIIISGYVQEGFLQGALIKFQQMQCSGVEPNEATFVSLLGLCSTTTAIDEGNLIHTLLVNNHCEQDVNVGSALVYMYLKCGNLRDAQSVFERLPHKTVTTWSAMIEGLARQGHEGLALEVFDSMQKTGVKPDEGTLISLLSASGHVGLKEGGFDAFNLITHFHKVSPSVDHFNCIVDILGRSGFLREAEDLLVTLEANTNLIGWLTLLSHCQNRGNVVLGRRCFDQVMYVDCNNAAAHTLMSSIYSQANMVEDLQNLESSRMFVHGGTVHKELARSSLITLFNS